MGYTSVRAPRILSFDGLARDDLKTGPSPQGDNEKLDYYGLFFK